MRAHGPYCGLAACACGHTIGICGQTNCSVYKFEFLSNIADPWIFLEARFVTQVDDVL